MKADTFHKIADFGDWLGGAITAPFRMALDVASFLLAVVWNVFLVVLAIGLEIAWLSFLFGSVVGVVLLLIFAPRAFLLPLALLDFMAPLNL